MTSQSNGLTYAQSGVDIDAGNTLIDRIKPAAARTKRPGVMDGLGGFGAMFDLAQAGYRDPILVAATDGVGTKLKVAIETGIFETIGVDLVAMCVNDLVCQGAEPLCFLDYFATGKLELDAATKVIEGIAAGCKQSGAALIGGETAEMPGLYAPGDFDLAGFAIGAMERGASLPREMRIGDLLIGLRSDGVHANGFSLVRKIVEIAGLDWRDRAPFANAPLGAALLQPTKLYVHQARAATATDAVHALAHITGGGLSENIPRVLSAGLGARIDLNAWSLPPVFSWLADQGKLDHREMLRTFNAGIGMVLIVDQKRVGEVQTVLAAMDEDPILLGEIISGTGVEFNGSFS